jgi:hypothetical protein
VSINRRQFLNTLAAAGIAGVTGLDVAVAAAESPEGTTVPSATQLVDAAGGVWTLSQGLVLANGADTRFPSVAVSLLYSNHNVFASDAIGRWWYNNQGVAWVAAGESPQGTTVPSATQLVDGAGGVWTLSHGLALANGYDTRFPSAAVSLLYWNHNVYASDASGNWWYNNQGAAWIGAGDPRTGKPFYAINGHSDYNFTSAELIAVLKDLGVTNYRLGTGGDATSVGQIASIAKVLQGSGISVYAMLDSNIPVPYGTEAENYNIGYGIGQTVASQLGPLGVTVYECGNELTRKPSTCNNMAASGYRNWAFINAGWPALRGVIRGLRDGVKAAQPSARCGVNFCVADMAAALMLWNGTQPDGSTGYNTCQWDITMWHNYEVYGDMLSIITDGGANGPRVNLFAELQKNFGKPIWLTEWSPNPEDAASFKADFLTTGLGEFYNARNTYGIESVAYFELMDDTWGVLGSDKVTRHPNYTAMKNFIAAHPA